MPGAGRIPALEELRRRLSSLRILVLTDHPEDAFAVRCFRAGALGYLTKDHAAEDLLAAVRKVGGGRKHANRALVEPLAAGLASCTPGLEPHLALSRTERHVLRALAQTESVSEIASRLEPSPKTMSTYRLRVLEKLGLRSTAELMRYAIERRLVVLRRGRPPAED